MFKKAIDYKKVVFPVAALVVIVADSFGYSIAQEDVQNVLNSALAILAALGILTDPTKTEPPK